MFTLKRRWDGEINDDDEAVQGHEPNSGAEPNGSDVGRRTRGLASAPLNAGAECSARWLNDPFDTRHGICISSRKLDSKSLD